MTAQEIRNMDLNVAQSNSNWQTPDAQRDTLKLALLREIAALLAEIKDALLVANVTRK
jgi:hypothetical protein